MSVKYSVASYWWLILQYVFHDNSGPCLTISGLYRVTVVLVRRSGIRQPLISVLVVKSI